MSLGLNGACPAPRDSGVLTVLLRLHGIRILAINTVIFREAIFSYLELQMRRNDWDRAS